MHKFFERHIITPDEGDALRLIHDKVEKAQDKFRTHKGDKYMRELYEAYDMICDFFEVKGIDSKSFFEAD